MKRKNILTKNINTKFSWDRHNFHGQIAAMNTNSILENNYDC